MLTEERHDYILEQLNQLGIVKIQDLSAELNTSISTLRRDLVVLEEAGKLQRIHGGAKAITQLDQEMEMSQKSTKNVQEKKQIGRLAATLVQECDVIFIDAGSTTIEMIPFLKDKQITVVTNGVAHVSLLADLGLNTYLIGGQIKHITKAIVGNIALENLAHYQFDKAFLGTNGIHTDFGYTTPDPEEAALKALAHKHARESYVLADASKLGKLTFAHIFPIQSVTLVTEKLDKKIASDYKKRAKLLEVEK